MSESTPGVTVSTHIGTNIRDHWHPEGHDIRVRDGHLHVEADEARAGAVLAVYAPGKWTHAKLGKS